MTTTAPVDLLTAAVNAQFGRVGPGLYGVACSGGADSVALADAAIRVAGGAHVVVLTIDHGLTAGSADVAARVATWAHGQGAAGVVRRVRVEPRASLEAAARTARYAALTSLADELGLACIMTAHTARDQAETVVLRLLRGTGPAGLAAIPARRGIFVRPLLAIERGEIERYVRDRKLAIFDDPMNSDRRLARVRVREEILPALRRENPQLDRALVRLARSAAEWLDVIDALARPFAAFPIACSVLAEQPAAVRKRAVSLALEAAALDYDASHLDDIDRMITADARGHVALDVRGGSVIRSYDTLEISVCAGPPSAPPRSLSPHPGYELRAWRPGDRMRPARLRGRSRKLSDLYIDAKLPRAQRAIARVLVRTSDATIVWAEHLGDAFGEPPRDPLVDPITAKK